MKTLRKRTVLILFLLFGFHTFAQTDSSTITNDSVAINDSINESLLHSFNQKINEIEQLRLADSIKKAELEIQLNSLKTTDNLQKEELLKQLKAIDENEKQRIAEQKAKIQLLRTTAKSFPVIGVLEDTLFSIGTRMGAEPPKERAARITEKITELYDNDFLNPDSILVVKSDLSYDIIYGETIIMSISEYDAYWYDKSMPELAGEFRNIISTSIIQAKKENSFVKWLIRIGLVILVLVIARLIVWLIGKGYDRLLKFIHIHKNKWLKEFSYKDYTFLTKKQELQIVLFLAKFLKWFIFAVLLYVILPILFSIFPFSRDWAGTLFHLVWSPSKNVFVSIWDYLPNLFSILVIYFVMRYVIRFVRYIFAEIKAEKLEISGFHSDWAMPTFSIVKFLLYAFMFVLIFPLLPGSDSNIFKGVSVFVGILFSLGSSTAIANMVAGLVITYMRPFQIGDRIKIADVTGDVIEKSLLVTRIKTVKNEIITIPNASVLSGNTTNYTSQTEEEGPGLIIYTSVTIGYDVPWKKMHETLLEAALRTELILKDPKPFVLQTSLEDFYVAYQINAYTKEASKQALIYSELHQNIQDCCNEAGIEILSPHYRAARDGNMITIPANYLPKDYEIPGFHVNVENKNKKQ
jgi:small-conductance mechanosensitive channel